MRPETRRRQIGRRPAQAVCALRHRRALAVVVAVLPAALTDRRSAWFAPPALWVTAPALLFLAAYTLIVWPQWGHNPDLSHGFFTPLVFALLLHESRHHGTARWLPDSTWRTGASAGAIGAACLLFAMSGLLAASVGWSHSLVNFVLAAALCAALLGGLLCLAGETIRLVPFNWIALSAIALWLLSAPLPHGTYARLTLHLQTWVTTAVLHTLHWLGVPARQHGNIIELASTTVGIEEACSGIRSLLSCIYAGFFFAAWQVRRPAGRVLILVLAPALAVLMNFVRSLTLTLMADANVDISGFWHDATGFAILGVTAVLLGLLALFLSPRAGESPHARAAERAAANPAGTGWCFRVFGVGSTGICALALFFVAYSRPAKLSGQPAIAVDALLPRTADGWHVETARDLYRFTDVLQTTQLVERTYFKVIEDRPVHLVVYVAHWAPGQAPVSQVASHTPDACWPGAGWVPQNNPGGQPALTLDGRRLPWVEYRVFRHAGMAAEHVWFWHIYDGRVINYRDPYSVPALIELALRYGFRREGDQYFVRISSNAGWELLAKEPLVHEIFQQLNGIGLAP
jgi:exosortase